MRTTALAVALLSVGCTQQNYPRSKPAVYQQPNMTEENLQTAEDWLRLNGHYWEKLENGQLWVNDNWHALNYDERKTLAVNAKVYHFTDRKAMYLDWSRVLKITDNNTGRTIARCVSNTLEVD